LGLNGTKIVTFGAREFDLPVLLVLQFTARNACEMFGSLHSVMLATAVRYAPNIEKTILQVFVD